MQWYFFFFLVSGFCSILYEIVWLRLAMAQYGVTTPLVSLILSVFMLGLGLGSWAAGRLVRKWGGRFSFPPLLPYALTELVIGCSALVVPFELAQGRQLLERFESNGLSSTGYYLAAGAWIAFSLVPWCAAMGATFPFALFAIKEERRPDSEHSFSFLYLANVLGAVMGAWLPLFLIEALGFHKTLQASSMLNFFLAGLAIILGFRRKTDDNQPLPIEALGSVPSSMRTPQETRLLWLLFGTGLTSMAAEVAWVRMYTPFLGTMVYAFAAILASYLGATYLGSLIYRKMLRLETGGSLVWIVLGSSALLPLLAADPRLPMGRFTRLGLGLVPFSAVLGFVTPLMVDRVSGGNGERAGRAYAVNVAGCILGPLISAFVLLPTFGERASLGLLALPWFVIGLFAVKSTVVSNSVVAGRRTNRVVIFAFSALSVIILLSTSGFEDQFPHHRIRRDYTATVVAYGDSRLEKRLLVNGVGMTGLRPATKMMAHLPLAMLDRKPTNMLIICFGMGTTHRSALSWGISSTVVELVPSVPQMYGYFHEDGPSLMLSPRSHVVIDDGRLFLERTSELYDVITVDPPPPPEAAGSSLLYSKEFYALIKRHLREGGILQQWLPQGAEPIVVSSVAKALEQSFPNVRVFASVMDNGTHFLATFTRIPPVTPDALASRMPASAAVDLVEWGPESTPASQFAAILHREIPIDQLIQYYPNASAMVDDRPVNEYYYLRHRPAFVQRIVAYISGNQ